MARMSDLFSPEPELDPIDTTDPVLQQQAEMNRFFKEIQADIALQVLSGADTIVNRFDPNDFRNFPQIFSYLVGIFGKEREVPAQTVINNEEFNIYFASRYGSESEEAEQLAEIKTGIAETAQKQELWEEQILPALEAGGDFVKTALFGTAPSGGPKSTTAMFEEWMERSLNDLKGPITLTVDPEEGLLLEIMIPVNFEVNGEPLKIKIFDEDGNFVGVEEIKEAFFDPDKGVWGRIKDGVFEPIKDIFDPEDTDSRTAVERIFDAAESIIVQTGLGGVEQGGWLGEVLTAEILGPYFFDEKTNTLEGTEDGTLDGDSDLENGDTDFSTEEEPVDTDGAGPDDNMSPPIDEGPLERAEDEDKQDDREREPPVLVPRKEPPQQLEDDSSDQGTGQQLPPADTGDFQPTPEVPPVPSQPKDDDKQQEDDRRDQETEQELPPYTDMGDYDPIPEVPTPTPAPAPTPTPTPAPAPSDDEQAQQLPSYSDTGDFQPIPDVPPVTGEPIGGEDRRDGGGEEGGDEQDELPVQGAPGAPGATGARGAPGASAPRPGFMGGLSYQLPGFVGVEYQPKDYMRELDRIIGESLFGDMI